MSDPNKTTMLTADPNKTMLGAGPNFDPNKTMLGTAPSLNATQTIKPVQCPVCKTFNPAGVIFCVDCGLIFDRALPDDAFGAPAVQLPTLIETSGKEQAVRPGTSVVGREGDIAIVDGRVSRRHAQFTYNNGVLALEDLGSTNGTKVDGTALSVGQKKELKGGEKISFGGVEVVVSMPGGPKGNTTQVFASNKTSAMAAPPKKEAPPATLVGDGKEFPLRAGVNSFGRRAENDITISDPYVSGRHGQIEVTDSGVFLTDIGSSNGTVVNDAKLQANVKTSLSESDVIRLGSLEFKVRVNPKEA
ncbi:MAG TPA: FHA domain-containing protein [Fimbriimonas sp.]|nr:FHA domain-containing protein [Fimbriimonas sp.]